MTQMVFTTTSSPVILQVQIGKEVSSWIEIHS